MLSKVFPETKFSELTKNSVSKTLGLVINGMHTTMTHSIVRMNLATSQVAFPSWTRQENKKYLVFMCSIVKISNARKR